MSAGSAAGKRADIGKARDQNQEQQRRDDPVDSPAVADMAGQSIRSRFKPACEYPHKADSAKKPQYQLVR